MRYLGGENLKGCPEFQQLFGSKRYRFSVHLVVIEALYEPRSRTAEEPFGDGRTVQRVEDLRPFDFPYPNRFMLGILHGSSHSHHKDNKLLLIKQD